MSLADNPRECYHTIWAADGMSFTRCPNRPKWKYTFVSHRRKSNRTYFKYTCNLHSTFPREWIIIGRVRLP